MTRSFPPPESHLHHHLTSSLSRPFLLPPPPPLSSSPPSLPLSLFYHPWSSSPRSLRFLSFSLSFSRSRLLCLLVSSSYSQMRSRGMSRLGPSCPPIIILTGFNLNNAACGFHRHARARLIISRTNSPTRYPSMVYHPTSPATIIFFPPASSLSFPVFPVTEDLRFSFLRASLALFSG